MQASVQLTELAMACNATLHQLCVCASVLRPLGEFGRSVVGSTPRRDDQYREPPQTTHVRESLP